MTEEEWLACENPRPMIKFLNGKARDRSLRLFACACARRVWHLVSDDDSRRAITIAENCADGLPTVAELSSPPPRPLSSYCINNFPMAWTPNDYADAAAGDAANPNPYTAASSAYEMAQLAIDPDLDTGWRPALVGTEANPQAELLRDIFGNPFRPTTFAPEWRTDTAIALARTMYDSRDFTAMPILADAMQDAGCDNEDILSHCRTEQTHVRGCWVVDLVLGKS